MIPYQLRDDEAVHIEKLRRLTDAEREAIYAIACTMSKKHRQPSLPPGVVPLRKRQQTS